MHPASNASRFQPDDGPRPFAAEPAVGITTYGPLSASCRRAPGDNAGSHGITGNDARHDRSVRDPQLIDAVNPETVVHDCRGIAPLLAVQVWWKWLTMALRMKASNSAPSSGPGIAASMLSRISIRIDIACRSQSVMGSYLLRLSVGDSSRMSYAHAPSFWQPTATLLCQSILILVSMVSNLWRQRGQPRSPRSGRCAIEAHRRSRVCIARSTPRPSPADCSRWLSARPCGRARRSSTGVGRAVSGRSLLKHSPPRRPAEAQRRQRPDDARQPLG
jgi:hypothetical protein